MSCVARPAKVSLRLDLRHARLKQQQSFDKPTPDGACSSGNFSPNLQPPTPPLFALSKEPCIIGKIGNKYMLLEHLDGSPLRRCINIKTQEEFACKVLPTKRYRDTLIAHFRLDSNPHVNTIEEVLVGEAYAYIIFPKCHGDLHSYVRQKRNLREPEARRLFRQVVSTVAFCHEAGIVLRDVKLRKFVFRDPERTQLKLETLDDSVILDREDDDRLSDKHGCPAYVSPEILTTLSNYSGKAADVWSLGVMLYTMLVGRYPFHDMDPTVLFNKIRRGCFSVPELLSSRAKCLIRCLLCMDPSERLTSEEVLDHPWFKMGSRRNSGFLDTSFLGSSDDAKITDQIVPDMDIEEKSSSHFV